VDDEQFQKPFLDVNSIQRQLRLEEKWKSQIFIFNWIEMDTFATRTIF